MDYERKSALKLILWVLPFFVALILVMPYTDYGKAMKEAGEQNRKAIDGEYQYPDIIAMVEHPELKQETGANMSPTIIDPWQGVSLKIVCCVLGTALLVWLSFFIHDTIRQKNDNRKEAT